MPNDTQIPAAAVLANTIMVPFNKLIADPENVRKTRSPDSIPGLADNILAEGLLQNLVVRKVKGGKFAVLGGERRRQALALLIERKAMKKSDEVPCRLIEDSATSASLAENIHRVAMHPADQFEAWTKLQDEGLSVREIAIRHGVSAHLVEQRLKLGRLSPVLLEAFRTEEISLETAAAFTLTDDRERQEAVYEATKAGWRGVSAAAVRAAITETEITSTDKLAQFVGRDAYEADGGEIRGDLFQDIVYFKDGERLTRLACEKLEAEAARLKSEGWAWIEIAFDEDYRAGDKMRQIRAKPVDLSAEDQATVDQLTARRAEIEDATYQEDETALGEFDEIEVKLAALGEKARAFNPKDQAIAGGFLCISFNGKLKGKLGFIRSEDDPKLKAEKKNAPSENSTSSSQYGKSLRDDMAAIRLEILQTELLANPVIARDLLAFHTVRDALICGYQPSPFELSAHQAYGRRCASEKGDMGIFEQRERVATLTASLPLDWMEIEDSAESFAAFRQLSEDEKTGLQAYAAAHMLKAQLNDEDQTVETLECAARMMQLDVTQYWTPGKAFFERLAKSHLAEIARTLIDPEYAQAHAKDKKAALAEALGDAFDPSVRSLSVDAEARNRLAAWVPECMTVYATEPVAAEVGKDAA